VQTRWFHSTEPPSTSITDTLCPFSYQIEVIGILAQIHRFLRTTVDIKIPKEVENWKLKYRTLDKALSTWKRGLPAAYSNVLHRHSPMDPAWVLLHIYYNITVIRLHSAAAYPSTRSTIFKPSNSAEQRCLAAVENITVLTRLVLQHDDSGDANHQPLLPKLGPTFCFTIWIAARLLIVHASSTVSASASSPDVTLFLGCLRRAGMYWQTARRYAEILQRVLDELESRCSGDDAGACLMILRDMRMTAYTVDVMISRQPDRRATKGMGGGDGGIGGAGAVGCAGMAPGMGGAGSVGCAGMAPATGGAVMMPMNGAGLGVAVNGAGMTGGLRGLDRHI
jgi:hypothetical protein